jgi:hypothetical protein
MLKGRRRLAIVLAAVGVCAVGFSGVALAAGSAPTLVSPHHGQRVNPGKIRLIVSSPGLPVFAQITRRRKLNKSGHLAQCLALKKGCDFVELLPWKHHPHKYIWVSSGADFPGFWATTPGRYYWQAHYNNCFATEVDSCKIVSAIGSFRVR